MNAEIDRMLADPKAARFVESFAGQWLSTRAASAFVADEKVFSDYDDALRLSWGQETNIMQDTFGETTGGPLAELMA